jgi:hypothetical protein
MARAVTFEAESSKDLAPFGLVEPRARITISDGKRAQTIRLGNPVKDKKSKIYAKMEGRPPVVTVEGRLLDDLPQQRDAVKKEDKIKAGDKKGKKAE